MTFLPWYSTILWSATTSVSTFFSRLTADLGIRFFFNFNFPWDLMCLVLSLTDLSFFSNISIKIHFIINKSKSTGVFFLQINYLSEISIQTKLPLTCDTTVDIILWELHWWSFVDNMGVSLATVTTCIIPQRFNKIILILCLKYSVL